MNRYLFANFDSAIRPVESQAVVAALHAFQPRIVLDAHSDLQNVVCAINPFSLEYEAIQGDLPSFECLGSIPKPTITTAREYMVETRVGSWLEEPESEVQLEQSVANFVIQYIKPKVIGHVQRFGLLQSGVGYGTSNLAANAVGGIHLLVETMAFGVAFRPAVAGYTLEDDGITLDPSVGRANPVIEPCFLPDAICVATLATEAFLLATLDIVDEEQPSLSDGYCSTPYVNGAAAEYREEDGWSSEFATDGLKLEPGPGQFDDLAMILAGTCPADPANT